MVFANCPSVDSIPCEQFFLDCLQKQISFSINNKVIRQGKLLLFRRNHFFIQLALQTTKTSKENFDIPMPFNVDQYDEEGLLYFDYRLDSLRVDCLPLIPEKIFSAFLNKILEIQVSTCI